jgi:LPS sulfotransferase NodH
VTALARDSDGKAHDLRGYAICTTPRSGSSLLCALLQSTGNLGYPTEYFNANALRREDPGYPDDPQSQLQRVLDGATPNGVYAAKLFPDQLETLLDSCAWTRALPNLKYVSLERRDLLGQALSAARAGQTGSYNFLARPRKEPRYDADYIRFHLRRLAGLRACWMQFFARTGITPLYVTYDELVADKQAVVDRVAGFVGVEPTPIKTETYLKIQRDALTDQWRERFIAEEGSGDILDPLKLKVRRPKRRRRLFFWKSRPQE